MSEVRCAFCRRELEDPKQIWRRKDGYSFCSEFCAESDPETLFTLRPVRLARPPGAAMPRRG
jgi:hypothetical protein